MALFRVDFSGRGELAERQQKLAQMLSRLQKISEGLRRAITCYYMVLHGIKCYYGLEEVCRLLEMFREKVTMCLISALNLVCANYLKKQRWKYP